MIISSAVQVLSDYVYEVLLWKTWCGREERGSYFAAPYVITYCSNTFVHQTLTYLSALASRQFFINITQGWNKNPAETTRFLSACVARFFDGNRNKTAWRFFALQEKRCGHTSVRYWPWRRNRTGPNPGPAASSNDYWQQPEPLWLST